MIVDKSATVQSTVVTKMCLSLLLCSTIHELSVLHAEECAAFYQSKYIMLRVQRTVRGMEKRRRILVQAVVLKVFCIFL